MALRPILDGGRMKRSARSIRAAQTRRERREGYNSAFIPVRWPKSDCCGAGLRFDERAGAYRCIQCGGEQKAAS